MLKKKGSPAYEESIIQDTTTGKREENCGWVTIPGGI